MSSCRCYAQDLAGMRLLQETAEGRCWMICPGCRRRLCVSGTEESQALFRRGALLLLTEAQRLDGGAATLTADQARQQRLAGVDAAPSPPPRALTVTEKVQQMLAGVGPPDDIASPSEEQFSDEQQTHRYLAGISGKVSVRRGPDVPLTEEQKARQAALAGSLCEGPSFADDVLAAGAQALKDLDTKKLAGVNGGAYLISVSTTQVIFRRHGKVYQAAFRLGDKGIVLHDLQPVTLQVNYFPEV